MTERMEMAETNTTTIQWPFERGQSAEGHDQEKNLIEALRAGNELAFEALLERLSPSMLGIARSILRDSEMAEEVVQDTWLAAIQGLKRFEGRSSLKTWIFSILTNVARTRAKRERRTIAFSSLSEVESPADKLAAASERFSDHRHAWMSPPRRRRQTPEDCLLSREAVTMIRKALQSMPSRQAEVVSLRDIEGWSAEEVCQSLGLTEANQKVLLHRGRTRVRDALKHYRDTKGAEHPRVANEPPCQSRMPRLPQRPRSSRARPARCYPNSLSNKGIRGNM